MNHDDTLAVVRSSLAGTTAGLADVHMDRPAEAIMRRARARRLRRAVPGVGAGALALGLALSLSGAPSSDPGAPPTASGGSAHVGGVHVNLAAWSVNTLPNGLVNVTLRELKDPQRLSTTLADAGIPVVLTSGRVCGSDGKLQVDQVVRKVSSDDGLAVTIDPAAIPAGTELVIGLGTYRNGSEQGPAAAFGLEEKGSRMDCSGGDKTVTP
jgi:hypothetical protein